MPQTNLESTNFAQLLEDARQRQIARRKTVKGETPYTPDNCPLCRLIEGEYKTHVHLVSDEFIIVDCETCNVPMAVYHKHQNYVGEDIRERMTRRLIDLFGKGAEIDTRMRTIPEHYHIHAR